MTPIATEPVNTLAATIAAGGIAALLAPFLYGLVVGPITGESMLMGLSIWISALIFAPLVFFVIWMLAIAGGLLLSLFRVRHIAPFILAGAVVATIAQQLAPLFVEVGQGQITASNSTEAILAVAVAGGIDGAIFWLTARWFSKKRGGR